MRHPPPPRIFFYTNFFFLMLEIAWNVNRRKHEILKKKILKILFFSIWIPYMYIYDLEKPPPPFNQ